MEPLIALFHPCLFFFDPELAGSRERQVKRVVRKKSKSAPRIVCANCKQEVTDAKQRIAVQGAHTHVFTNPTGITYDIACYRQATGCVPTGDATTAFTWFSGYAWRIALCANCQTHLGWRFETASDGFYGLIRDRLITPPADTDE